MPNFQFKVMFSQFSSSTPFSFTSICASCTLFTAFDRIWKLWTVFFHNLFAFLWRWFERNILIIYLHSKIVWTKSPTVAQKVALSLGQFDQLDSFASFAIACIIQISYEHDSQSVIISQWPVWSRRFPFKFRSSSFKFIQMQRFFLLSKAKLLQLLKWFQKKSSNEKFLLFMLFCWIYPLSQNHIWRLKENLTGHRLPNPQVRRQRTSEKTIS